jgi:hypothetical protein
MLGAFGDGIDVRVDSREAVRRCIEEEDGLVDLGVRTRNSEINIEI